MLAIKAKITSTDEIGIGFGTLDFNKLGPFSGFFLKSIINIFEVWETFFCSFFYIFLYVWVLKPKEKIWAKNVTFKFWSYRLQLEPISFNRPNLNKKWTFWEKDFFGFSKNIFDWRENCKKNFFENDIPEKEILKSKWF